MVSESPKHIAIVLDGNRRFAKKLGLQPLEGHEYGIKKLEELFEWCLELGIKELTLYSFSTENFKRSKKEINFLFGLFKKKFEEIKGKRDIFKDHVRVRVIGRMDMFPAYVKKPMFAAVEKTKNNSKLVVNFALGYGGRQEIADSFKKILKNDPNISPGKINEILITQSLYLQSEPDLVIRPGGEKRTSNFLTWQTAYSEWIFIDKFWPEFTKEDLIDCIKEFKRRERRFGG